MPAAPQPNMGVIVEKLNNISTDVAEIKTTLTCHVEAQAKFEQETISSRAVTQEKIANIKVDVDDHTKRLEALEKIVNRLAITDAILRWLAIVLMGSLITLVIGILTHQVVLSFP